MSHASADTGDNSSSLAAMLDVCAAVGAIVGLPVVREDVGVNVVPGTLVDGAGVVVLLEKAVGARPSPGPDDGASTSMMVGGMVGAGARVGMAGVAPEE